jgi:hypothetical protein
MRPTGRMHIGHYHGALKNWVRLQQEYECYFFVADWHALTTNYESPEIMRESIWEMVIDWLAPGLDPAQCAIFIQSRVPGARGADAAARDDHLGRLARARADVQGTAAEPVGQGLVDVRLPRLSR